MISVHDATVSLTHVLEGSRRRQSAPSRQIGGGQQVAVAKLPSVHKGRDASDGHSTAAPQGASAATEASAEMKHVLLGWPGCSQARRGSTMLVSRWPKRSATKRNTARRAITAAFSRQWILPR